MYVITKRANFYLISDPVRRCVFKLASTSRRQAEQTLARAAQAPARDWLTQDQLTQALRNLGLENTKAASEIEI